MSLAEWYVKWKNRVLTDQAMTELFAAIDQKKPDVVDLNRKDQRGKRKEDR